MLAVPLFGLPLAVPSVILAGALLVDAEFHSQYRSCDQLQNRGLHVDSTRGFDGRRHRSSDPIDELYFL